MTAAAISRLRQVATRLAELSAPGDGLAAWFAGALAQFEAGAPHGMTLAQAFGLERTAGERGWWTLERLELRDAQIRELARAHFPGLPPRAAARGIRKRRDLLRQLPAPVSESTLRRALAHESPPFAEPTRQRGSRP